MISEIKRILQPVLRGAKRSFLLLGPRQTGKSTLIRNLNPDTEINLADEEVFISFASDAGQIKKRITSNTKTVFIDEVQRLPSLLNTIQVILDSPHHPQFFLTGSSARKLKRGKANLLPGRIFTYELGPLSLTELGNLWNLERALSVGLLPEPYLEQDLQVSQKLLRTYSITYLKEEVQAEALTRNIEGFARFFSVVSSRNGDFIDFTKFASHAQIERMSAKRYFEILEDTLVLYPVEPFTKSTRRRLVQHPKYYFFDVGVFNGAVGNFEVSGDRIGLLLENLVLQLLASEFKARDFPYRVSVYRTEAGAEVDFIFELKKDIWAIEVKSAKTIHSTDLNGLKSFKEFVGKKKTRCMILYLGINSQVIDGIEVFPVKKGIEAIFAQL